MGELCRSPASGASELPQLWKRRWQLCYTVRNTNWFGAPAGAFIAAVRLTAFAAAEVARSQPVQQDGDA